MAEGKGKMAFAALPPVRGRRTYRVVTVIGFFTLEDIRWMIRVDRDCKALRFSPSDYFERLETAITEALEGRPISSEDEQDLKDFIQGDKHWTKLFREQIMPNYPVLRTANRVLSESLTGGEMYYQWDPDKFFKDLELLTREKPLFEVWPHQTISFSWNPDPDRFSEDELETLRFYTEADLDYVFRVPPIEGLTTHFPISKTEIMNQIERNPNNLSHDAASLLAAMFKNDVVIWRITEQKIGRLIPLSNVVWPWGREIYESTELKTITEKLLWQMKKSTPKK